MWATSGNGTLNIEAGGEVSSYRWFHRGRIRFNGRSDGHRRRLEVDQLGPAAFMWATICADLNCWAILPTGG